MSDVTQLHKRQRKSRVPASRSIVLNAGVRRRSRLSEANFHLLGERSDIRFLEQRIVRTRDCSMRRLRSKSRPCVLNFAVPHIVDITGRPEKPDLARIRPRHIVISRTQVRIEDIARQQRARQR